MRRFLLVPLIALVACSSTPSSGTAALDAPVRVTLTQWHDGQYFELVNDRYTTEVESQSRVELYSAVRSDAQRKVQSDEVTAELLKFFDDHGFDELSTAGHAPAPKVGATDGGWTIEVEESGQVRFALTVGRTAEDKVALLTMIQAFFEIWNNTFSLQSVEIEEGQSPFQQPEPPGR